MSLIETNNYFPDLFLNKDNNIFLNYSTISDNLNDIFSESLKEPRKKNVKFILTKEEFPSISFLKKRRKKRRREFERRKME